MMGHRRLTFARGTCFEDNSRRTPVSREQRRAFPNRMESIMPATRTDGDTRFLDPAIFATVDNLEMLARFIVEGFMIGLHRSPYHGFSVEFSSYRKYSPGDEPRYVDWKLFGKTDRLYVKQFEENTNLVCTLCVDCSGSMKVGDKNLTKFKYATSLAAALAYLLLKQGDAVGLVAFSEREVEVVRPRSRTNYLARLLAVLARIEPRAETNIHSGLAGVAERMRRRGLVVLISDFFADIDDLVEQLKRLRYRGHEVIAFQILTTDERDFPFKDLVEFIDAETDERLITQTSYVADSYRKALGEHQERLRSVCRDHNIDLVELTTADNLDVALLAYLSRRSRRSRRSRLM